MDTTTKGQRVIFTSTGAAGVVEATFTNDSPYAGDLAGAWATVRFDDGETIDVRVADLSEPPTLDDIDARRAEVDAAEVLVVMYRRMVQLAGEYNHHDEIARARRLLEQAEEEADRLSNALLELQQQRYGAPRTVLDADHAERLGNQRYV